MGKTVILLLVQTGAVTYITFFSCLLLRYGKKIAYINSMLEKTTLNIDTEKSFFFMFRRVLLFVFIVEFIGALLLCGVFVPLYGWGYGSLTALFFSVFAFCGAGFSVTSSGSVMFLSANLLFNLAMYFIMIIGSIGFAAVIDIITKKSFFLYETNTKIIIITVFAIVLTGASFILVSEAFFNRSFFTTAQGSVLSSLFLSISSRGAGFVTVEPASLNPFTKIILIILMFFGIAPTSASCGVNGISVIVSIKYLMSCIRKEKTVCFAGKYIDGKTLRRAVCYVCISAFLCLFASLLFMFLSPAPALDCVFDAVSSFMCNGFTLGAVAQGGLFIKIFSCLFMIAGRYGILVGVYYIDKRPLKSSGENTLYYNDSNILI